MPDLATRTLRGRLAGLQLPFTPAAADLSLRRGEWNDFRPGFDAEEDGLSVDQNFVLIRQQA
jgi:hypothetical protein